jgi:hypothetical protein
VSGSSAVGRNQNTARGSTERGVGKWQSNHCSSSRSQTFSPSSSRSSEPLQPERCRDHRVHCERQETAHSRSAPDYTRLHERRNEPAARQQRQRAAEGARERDRVRR